MTKTTIEALREVVRRFEATIPTPMNARGESTMRIEHFVDLVHEAKQELAALAALSQGEAPRYRVTTGHCPAKSAGSRDCGQHNLHCNWPKCDERVELLNPTHHPEAQQPEAVAWRKVWPDGKIGPWRLLPVPEVVSEDEKRQWCRIEYATHPTTPPKPAEAETPAVALIGWVFQHAETGHMSFCPNDGINTPEVFVRINSRFVLCGPAYAHPTTPTHDGGGVTDEMVDRAMRGKYRNLPIPDALAGAGDEETEIIRAILTAALTPATPQGGK